jgi:hypothetical protein
MRAVRHHTDCKWVLLYIERWLKAPVSMPNGTLVSREAGDPAGLGYPVTLDTIAGALCAYCLIGLTWAFVYRANLRDQSAVVRVCIRGLYSDFANKKIGPYRD